MLVSFFLQVILPILVEGMKLFPIMLVAFKFEFQTRKRILIITSIFLLFCGICFFSNLTTYMPIHIFLFVIYSVCILKGKGHTLYTVLTFISISVLDMLSASIHLLISGEQYNELAGKNLESLKVNAGSIIVIVCICVFVYYIRKRNLVYGNRERISGFYLFFFLLGEISLYIYITSFQVSTIQNYNQNARITSICLCLGTIVFLMGGIVLFITDTLKRNYKNMSEMNQKVVELQSNYYEMLQEKHSETRKFRHDIAKHINCMCSLYAENKLEELGEYLHQMGGEFAKLRPNVQTGNELVDAMLWDFLQKYKEVQLHIVGKLPDKMPISNMDICTIFYNLFENAFCAANCSKDKRVEITIGYQNEKQFIEISNSIDAKVQIYNQKLETSKQNKKMHGFGVENVKQCVRKNKGIIEFESSDSRFLVQLIL